MMPIGPLMIEHRLIERMIARMGQEAERIGRGAPPDTDFVRAAVDFIKTYADRLHHGKEENILFRELAKKRLSAEHGRIMDELIREHVRGRENTQELGEARDRYLAGDKAAAKAMAEALGRLAKMYPRHIEKEDKHFFLPAMAYFTPDEKEAMLAESNEFDRQFVHAAYRSVVSEWESK